MKTAEDILNENLLGVHKEMISKHWAFKKYILEAMEEYAAQDFNDIVVNIPPKKSYTFRGKIIDNQTPKK